MKSFDIFDQFATDPNLELEGTWVPIGPALRMKEDGTTPDPDSAPQLRVARANNKRYSRMLVTMYEANKSVLDMKNDAADAKNDEVNIELMARTVLLGWKNLSFKKEALPDGYELDTAKKLLAVKDFRELVGRLSADPGHYKLVKETSGN